MRRGEEILEKSHSPTTDMCYYSHDLPPPFVTSHLLICKKGTYSYHCVFTVQTQIHELLIFPLQCGLPVRSQHRTGVRITCWSWSWLRSLWTSAHPVLRHPAVTTLSATWDPSEWEALFIFSKLYLICNGTSPGIDMDPLNCGVCFCAVWNITQRMLLDGHETITYNS